MTSNYFPSDRKTRLNVVIGLMGVPSRRKLISGRATNADIVGNDSSLEWSLRYALESEVFVTPVLRSTVRSTRSKHYCVTR